MQIRGMRAEDTEGYLECQLEVFESLRGTLPPAFIESEISWLREKGRAWVEGAIKDPERINLVAEDGGSIVGMATGRVGRGGLSTLGFMGVIPSMRRKGIGWQLLETFIEESRRRGAAKVTLNTASELKPAIKLYVEMGFLPEGLLRRHIHGVDAIVYSRFLD
ncbi:MAG: GNAT family N-acetyltransferase [Candidatus Bathyarchaeota archaeon]|nr:GNAT family N-acetyltransferase [Candidatus Bathyarchaeota archaeon]